MEAALMDPPTHADLAEVSRARVLDPVTDDVLAHEYTGRFAPAVLAQALEFRDGVCQAPAAVDPPANATSTTASPTTPTAPPRAGTSAPTADATTN
jgi:hypothetical protein